jgi:hypothetical protein
MNSKTDVWVDECGPDLAFVCAGDEPLVAFRGRGAGQRARAWLAAWPLLLGFRRAA